MSLERKKIEQLVFLFSLLNYPQTQICLHYHTQNLKRSLSTLYRLCIYLAIDLCNNAFCLEQSVNKAKYLTSLI